VEGHIKNLNDTQKEAWVKIANSALSRCEKDGGEAKACEGKAIRIANVMAKRVKASITDEQAKQMEMDFTEKQDTFDVEDKEIFRTGNWNGDKYTVSDLDDIVKSFEALKGVKEIPLKLGHDEDQKILQRDGYPAAGWVKSLKRKGDILLASFRDIPRKIKELIERKAYKKVSAEIWWDYRYGDKTYPRVLEAVGLLGADVPAVSGLGDWMKLYEEHDIRTYILPVNKKEGREMAEWDVKYVNDLPDSSFAFIESGGEKDEEGKTVPRALRHLPYKDAGGKVDLPHLRNALARLPQSTSLSPAEKAKAREKLVAAARAADVGEYEIDNFEREVKRNMELQKQVKDLEAKLAEATKEKETLKAKADGAEKKLSEQEQLRKQTEIKAFIEEQKKAGRILPRDEKMIAEILLSANETKKMKFTAGDKEVEMNQRQMIEKQISQLPEGNWLKEFSEKGAEPKKYDVPAGGSERAKKLYVFAREYQDGHKDVSFRDALAEVSVKHPELVEAE